MKLRREVAKFGVGSLADLVLVLAGKRKRDGGNKGKAYDRNHILIKT